jgi:hypothetical protein
MLRCKAERFRRCSTAKPMTTTTPTERLLRWIQASWKLAGHACDNHLVNDIQDVGYLEASIVQLEGRYIELEARGQRDDHSVLTFNQARALSRVWVLSFYEALRTYQAACKKANALDAWRPFRDFFRDLNNIREPLAKHEVAGRRDAHVPTLTYDPKIGFGWDYFNPRTNAYDQSFRRDIADRFLSIASTLAGAGEIEAARAAADDISDSR